MNAEKPKKPSRTRKVVTKVVEALAGPKPDFTIKFFSGGELIEEVPVYWRKGWDRDDDWDDL